MQSQEVISSSNDSTVTSLSLWSGLCPKKIVSGLIPSSQQLTAINEGAITSATKTKTKSS